MNLEKHLQNRFEKEVSIYDSAYSPVHQDPHIEIAFIFPVSYIEISYTKIFNIKIYFDGLRIIHLKDSYNFVNYANDINAELTPLVVRSPNKVLLRLERTGYFSIKTSTLEVSLKTVLVSSIINRVTPEIL